MSIQGDNSSVIVAGATGLIGGHVIEQLLAEPSVQTVYALTRSQIKREPTSSKLIQIINNDLDITQWDEGHPRPTLGVICLGTTIKQVGSKAALRKVDVELVTHVAQTMKFLGVERVAVVSSYGASPTSYSHYLKCKGQMEQNLIRIGFKQLFIARPGPLLGNRTKPRSDEKFLQTLSPLFKPFMIGRLKNLRPIESEWVAKTMLFKLFENNFKNVEISSSSEMLKFLAKYR
ncbi:NAD(P)H-binding protein [Vibrio sp. Isolate30]|uniref:NAD(P)H-binding protein n=1 Tax=Vibrio sp. Isolate30 TaxID=2908536 RepID=UPI001EFDF6F3|nr:NAD(P)H-binding protein [Vibrio sp. Isolate30]MCG9632333.1 NAD(P)H-binding protein [Vibrio sp. Isolate30]